MLLPVRVSPDGKLQLPQQLISLLGLKPNQKAVCIVEDGKLIIKPLTTIKDTMLEQHSLGRETLTRKINRLIAKR